MAFSFQSGARALRSTDLGLRTLFTSNHKGALRPDKFFKFFLWCQTFFFLLVVVPRLSPMFANLVRFQKVVLFLSFFFSSSCCCAHRLSPVSTDLVRFPKSSHISCRLGFVSFPSSRRFCANEQLPPVCFFFLPRILHDCCRFAVLLFYPFSAPQDFSRRFPRFHLCLFGLVQ